MTDGREQSETAMNYQALLLDRDGVINEDRPDFVLDWQSFRFLPGSLSALARLHRYGIPVIVITNQSCVGRGLLSHEGLSEIHRRMILEVRRNQGEIAGIYVCPHRPDEGCARRKPRPGLLEQALLENGLDRSRTLFVGDSITDFQAARAAQVDFALVATDKGASTLGSLRQDGESLPVFESLEALVRLHLRP